MMKQDFLVGVLVIVLCTMLVIGERWFLENTATGQRLICWFGSKKALWVLRASALAGIIFGGLLAAGVIRPVQWS